MHTEIGALTQKYLCNKKNVSRRVWRFRRTGGKYNLFSNSGDFVLIPFSFILLLFPNRFIVHKNLKYCSVRIKLFLCVQLWALFFAFAIFSVQAYFFVCCELSSYLLAIPTVNTTPYCWLCGRVLLHPPYLEPLLMHLVPTFSYCAETQG